MLRRARIAVVSIVVITAGLTSVAAQADQGSTVAPMENRVLAAARAAGPKGTIDVVVSLKQIAGQDLSGRLAHLATWSWAFKHIPVAGLRLPVKSIDALRHVAGVRGVFLNRKLDMALKDSAKTMNVAHAWNDLHITGKGVTVAVLDSGVDGTHPDLAPAMKQNVKLVELGAPFPVTPVEGVPNSDTSSGHGTHVAGDVAGRGIKSNGDYRGMAPDAGIVGVGAGEGLNIFTTVEGFDWIIANADKYQIRAVNNSWGSEFEPFNPAAPIHVATKTLYDKGVVVLFAMGNSYDELTMNPWAVAPWVIPVAAGTKEGAVVDFSSGGIEADVLGTSWNTGHNGDDRHANEMGLYHPAVTSTGSNVISTRALNTVVPLTGAPSDATDMPPDRIPYYTTLSGTSMATPETAGVVADILQADPALTPAQVRSVLEITARPISGAPFWKQGYGYTDASGAVELALSLATKSKASLVDVLAAKHAARDNALLTDIAHPAHAATWLDPSSPGPITLTHTMDVPAGQARFKVVTNGPSTLELNAVVWSIAVADAKGNTVADLGAITPNLFSGTAVLDIDLHKLDADAAIAAQKYTAIAWGKWTVTVSSVFSPAHPALNTLPLVSEFAPKGDIATIAASFVEAPKSCAPVQVFVPTETRTLRFQDDTSSGAPYPADPNYTYVGLVANGNLANRTPARNLVGAFGEFTSGGLFASTPQPRFSTAPLPSAITLGKGAVIETWVQGPSGMAGAGQIEAGVLDVAPDGTATSIASTGGTINMETGLDAPAKTDATLLIVKPYPIAAGHRLAVQVGVLHSQNTAADQLFYDSDAYPSGASVVLGKVATVTLCGVVTPGGGGVVPVVKPIVKASGAARPRRLPATGSSFPFAACAAITLLLATGARRMRKVTR